MEQNCWLKITIVCDPILVEPVSDFLIGIIDAGVETGAADEPNFGTIQAFVEKVNLSDEEIEGIKGRVRNYLQEMADIFSKAPPSVEFSTIEEEDWGKTWKVHFKPFAIIPGLVIAPTWEEYQAAPGEQVLIMDPGMAFGTGHHATTTLCLEYLRECFVQQQPRRVLDVGTGTGILGMGAALLGAEDVLGIDNDPEAVTAATANVLFNKLDGQMKVSQQPLGELTGTYDVVIANIISSVLQQMADDLIHLTAPGGTIVLSGLLAGEQVTGIVRTFTDLGMHLISEKTRQEWAAVRFARL